MKKQELMNNQQPLLKDYQRAICGGTPHVAVVFLNDI